MQHELEEACLVEAKAWFMQTANTPFLQPPLINQFQELGYKTEAFCNIAEGMYNIPQCLDDYTKQYITQL